MQHLEFVALSRGQLAMEKLVLLYPVHMLLQNPHMVFEPLMSPEALVIIFDWPVSNTSLNV